MKTQTNWSLALLLAIACMPILLGCPPSNNNGNGGDGTTTTDEAATDGDPNGGGETKLTMAGVEPAENDVLQMYYTDDPDTLNFVTSSDSTSTAFQRQVYESMGERDMADPSIWKPALAESWTFDEETLTWTIKLREGVMWHSITRPDDTVIEPEEFTAKDVKFTFDCILNPFTEAAHVRSYFTDETIEGDDKSKIVVETPGKYEVVIRWLKPYFMHDTFTLGQGIIPRHVYGNDAKGEPISFDYRSKEFADGFNKHWANSTMCGTGPMIFKEWNKSDHVSLERNPNYWGTPFYFSHINYRYIKNPNTARQKVLQNELDWAGFTEKNQYLEAKTHDAVVGGKVVLKEYQSTSYRYLGWNTKRDVFNDAKVRTALSHAVPVQAFIDDVFYGLARRVNGPFVPDGPFSSPNVKEIPFDLDKAKALLAEAGWEDSNESGTVDKMIDGKLVEFKFDLMIFSDAPSFKTMAEIVQENFRKIGVEVTITPTKWALMLQNLRKKDFDATILGWSADWKGDPYQIWHGSQADEPESSNSIGYKNPEVDALIDKLRVTVNEEDQIEIYHQIHEKIFADQPYTFLFAEKTTAGLDARIENWKSYPMLRPHRDTREWHSTSARVLGP